MKKIQLFLINGSILTLTSFLLRTIGVSFNVYISNKIGSEAVGVYSLVMSVYLFITTLALSGINFACMRLVSKEMAYGNTGGAKKVVTTCLLYCFVLGSFSGILLFLFAPAISTYWLHDKISSFPFYFMAVSLPFVSMSACITGYFSAVRRVAKNSSVQILEQVIKVFLISYLLTIFLPDTIDYACIALVLGTTVSEILSFGIMFLLYTLEKKEKKYHSEENFHKEILRISIPIAITSCIRSGLSTLKQILIPIRLEKSGISCTTALSQYGMIHGMVMPIILFPSTFIQSFSNLLVPEFSYYHTRSEINKIHYAVSKILKYTLLFSIGIVGIFIAFSDSISFIIYHQLELSSYIKLLAPLIVFMYLDNVIDGVLKGLDKQVGVMAVNIIDLFVSISFIYFLLPVFGILGYLFVIFVSEILNCALSMKELKKIISVKLNILNWIIKPIFACIFSFFTLYLFSFTHFRNAFELIIGIILFFFTYLIYLFFFRSLKKEDIPF